ncbi:MAG: bifunctional adenosylcobinamide kinase/adenosylcobinamide-phosphate guanylyltransferase [Termitinemataceae bacterium]|nr:MAG: bifunctional adenosylcobinamide kinase/adenosylcobinamide-phosphate guanylyltransferase [Termitinemataceae bacterium]
MITLITGGVKSGKSRRALEITAAWQFPITFIATASTLDDEMRRRVENHKTERAQFCAARGGLGICGHSICGGIECTQNGFSTIEEQLEIDKALERASSRVIFDCVVMWINNLIYYKREADFEKILNSFLSVASAQKDDVVIVSNETGFGNIPCDELTRNFNLMLSHANRVIAQKADAVEIMVCGLPLKIKT